MTSEKAVERSIDSLQRIYAVIVGLAMTEAIRRSFLNLASNEIEIHYEHLPEFIAFIFTAVPFVHGMNRHMDKVLNTSLEEKKQWLLFFLLVDFLFFLIESCVLVLIAISLTSTSKLQFFQILMTLFVIDIVWALLTWRITKTVVFKWLGVNIVTVALYMIVIYWFAYIPAEQKPWVLMGIAVLRTLLDYYLARAFYFPAEADTGSTEVSGK
jgi:hypothetical protein